MYNSLANVLRAKGEYTRSEPMYRKALLITESASGPFDSSLFSPLFNLAELLHYQGKYEDAEPMFRRCLGLIQEVGRMRLGACDS